MTAEGRRVPAAFRAYLATALTGLSYEERLEIDQISDAIAELCAEAQIELYEPRGNTDPVHHPEVPDGVVFDEDLRNVARSDVLIAVLAYPSFGVGQELMIAHAALVPIILIARAGSRTSRMVTGMPGVQTVPFENLQEMRERLLSSLSGLRPVADLAGAVWALGAQLKELRRARGMGIRDLAAIIGRPTVLDVADLEALEAGQERAATTSLQMLVAVADALGARVDIKRAGE